MKSAVCRSRGRTPKRCASSGENVEVKSLSASSSTYHEARRAKISLRRNEEIPDVKKILAYQESDPRQVPLATAAPQMVDQSAWGGNYHMWSPSKLEGLGHHVHSTHYHGRPYIEMSSKDRKLFGNLKCELSVEK